MASKTEMLGKFEGMCQDSTSKSKFSIDWDSSELNDFWEEIAEFFSNEWNTVMWNTSLHIVHLSSQRMESDSPNIDKTTVSGHLCKPPKEWEWQDKKTNSKGNATLSSRAHGER